MTSLEQQVRYTTEDEQKARKAIFLAKYEVFGFKPKSIKEVHSNERAEYRIETNTEILTFY